MIEYEKPRPITVNQLIARLAELPQDALVILASDAEGSKFRPMSADVSYRVTEGRWTAHRSGFTGDFVDVSALDDDSEANAITIWPA